MKKVIVFDSGIGGFSIVRQIVSRGIPVHIVYLGDQANFPYGDKEDVWLQKRLTEVAQWVKGQDANAFVLACNTGTVAGVTTVREVLSCPVIGVEPVIKPVASYNHALVLMTPSAAASARTEDLKNEYGQHIMIRGCTNLATAIEDNNQADIDISLSEIGEIVERHQIQALGLSCTHYPLIKLQFESRFPAVDIYDPTTAVVTQLTRVLNLLPFATGHKPLAIRFLTTGDVLRFNEQIERYFGRGYLGEKITI